MIKVTVTDRRGGPGWSAVLADQAQADAWIAQEVAKNSWGRPDRWVRDLEGLPADSEEILETRDVFDPDDVLVTEYHLRAEYTIEQEPVDDSAEVAARKRLAKIAFGEQLLLEIMLANDAAGIDDAQSLALISSPAAQVVILGLKLGTLDTVVAAIDSMSQPILPPEQIAVIRQKIVDYLAANP
jgi:hypothetical protein